MPTATVAMLQLRIDGDEPVAHRVDRALEWARSAACDADLVVLPELWHVGAFDMDAAQAHAESLDGPLVQGLSAVARDTGTWVHGGSLSERADHGRRFNTTVVFDPQGALAAVYRKIHLFGFTGGETTVMSSGSELVAVDTPLGRAGLATCYDLRFPELFRGLVDRGCTSVVMGSGWPSVRIDHWSTLVRARAIENQVVMIACNEVGTHAGTELGGRSLIVDAAGQVLAEGGTGEELIVAEVDLHATLSWRQRFPVLDDRRL